MFAADNGITRSTLIHRSMAVGRLVVRRVERLNKATIAADAGQGRLLTLWRHHGFVSNSALTAVIRDQTQRDHAIIEQSSPS